MDAIGAQEVQFPALLPREPYEATGRWTEYGDGMFRLKDRKGGDYLLGPTHEEMFTLLVKDLYSSYKDLPVWLYQIQTKYRDEARPRAGLLRGREFVMKDSYSFDVDDAGLDASYAGAPRAYVRIFDRLGLRLRHRQGHVRRDGRLGVGGVPGHRRESARTPTSAARTCDYAANVEAVQVRRPQPVPYDDAPAAHAEQTPGHPHDRDAGRPPQRGVPARRTGPGTPATRSRTWSWSLKHPDGTREPLAIGVPGDREVDVKRLGGQLEPTEVEAFTEADFAAHPTLVKGYIGPGVLGEKNASGIRYLVDPRVVEGTRWVTGADDAGRHVLDLVAGRDFTPDGTIEAAEVRDGDPCPLHVAARGTLRHRARHRDGPHLPLGRKYAEALGLQVLDENGKLVTVTMGSYGIGVVPRGRRDRREHPRRARPGAGRARSPRPTCTWSPPARTPRLRGRRAARRRARRPGRRPCSTTTARRSRRA